jgi:hypothetical protein
MSSQKVCSFSSACNIFASASSVDLRLARQQTSPSTHCNQVLLIYLYRLEES